MQLTAASSSAVASDLVSASTSRPFSLDEYKRYGRQMIMPGWGLPGEDPNPTYALHLRLCLPLALVCVPGLYADTEISRPAQSEISQGRSDRRRRTGLSSFTIPRRSGCR